MGRDKKNVYFCKYGIKIQICKIMISRIIEVKIIELAGKFPVISITGPRQSGKTTLAKKCFPDYTYVNLESPDTREFARSDPKSFLAAYKNGIIIDEVQYVPELFSYIQVLVDEKQSVGEIILTGSQNFLMIESITQSLAGRVALFRLVPFSLTELKSELSSETEYESLILSGMYPRLWDKNIHPADYYPQYIQTYIERDVRSLRQIANLNQFTRFLKLAAGRVGNVMNYMSLSNDVGVDVKTIQSWMSVLEASYICFFLPAYHKNYNKRIIKSPKLFFYDTGIVCSLLGIHSTDMLTNHPLLGNLFENFVISEIQKEILNHNRQFRMYFWRDSSNNEIDCLLEQGLEQKIVEVKSSRTVHSDFFKNLQLFQKLSEKSPGNSFLVYGDKEGYIRNNIKVIPWHSVNKIFEKD